jgi:hypothetical protein
MADYLDINVFMLCTSNRYEDLSRRQAHLTHFEKFGGMPIDCMDMMERHSPFCSPSPSWWKVQVQLEMAAKCNKQ